MIQVSLPKFKSMFFDRAVVMRAMGEADRRSLNHVGATIRKRARWSINIRLNSYSQPGQPPHSRYGTFKRTILYGYDTSRKSVIVGAYLFNGRKRVLPQLLEQGGTVSSPRRSFIVRRGKIVRIIPPGLRKYAARPYMGPALRYSMPMIPSHWKNSIVSP